MPRLPPRYTLAIHTIRCITLYLQFRRYLAYPLGPHTNTSMVWRAISNVEHALTHMETSVMSAKNSAKKPAWGNLIFHEHRLSASEKAEYIVWIGEDQHITNAKLEETAMRGYKASLSWNSKDKCFICTHTCVDEASPNHQMAISSRAGDVMTALFVNVYKIAVLYEFGAFQQKDGTADWG